MTIAAGLEPALSALDVSVAYTTGNQFVRSPPPAEHRELRTLNYELFFPPGNTRKECGLGASASRCLAIRDYAPAPQDEHNRQGLLTLHVLL